MWNGPSSRGRWVPDSLRPECVNCQQEFSFIRRRHHCRGCGEVFCDDCTEHRVKGHRSCGNCYNAAHASPKRSVSVSEGSRRNHPLLTTLNLRGANGTKGASDRSQQRSFGGDGAGKSASFRLDFSTPYSSPSSTTIPEAYELTEADEAALEVKTDSCSLESSGAPLVSAAGSGVNTAASGGAEPAPSSSSSFSSSISSSSPMPPSVASGSVASRGLPSSGAEHRSASHSDAPTPSRCSFCAILGRVTILAVYAGAIAYGMQYWGANATVHHISAWVHVLACAAFLDSMLPRLNCTRGRSKTTNGAGSAAAAGAAGPDSAVSTGVHQRSTKRQTGVQTGSSSADAHTSAVATADNAQQLSFNGSEATLPGGNLAGTAGTADTAGTAGTAGTAASSALSAVADGSIPLLRPPVDGMDPPSPFAPTPLSPVNQRILSAVDPAIGEFLRIMKSPEMWKLAGRGKGAVVWSSRNPLTGTGVKGWRGCIVVPAPPEEVLRFMHRAEEHVDWSPAVVAYRSVARLTSHVDITYCVSKSAAAGIISSRDFVCARTWNEIEGCPGAYFTGATGLIGAEALGDSSSGWVCPKPPRMIRGSNGPSGYLMFPVKPNSAVGETLVQTGAATSELPAAGVRTASGPNVPPVWTQLHWMVNSDLKGSLPRALVDSNMTKVIIDSCATVRGVFEKKLV